MLEVRGANLILRHLGRDLLGNLRLRLEDFGGGEDRCRRRLGTAPTATAACRRGEKDAAFCFATSSSERMPESTSSQAPSMRHRSIIHGCRLCERAQNTRRACEQDKSGGAGSMLPPLLRVLRPARRVAAEPRKSGARAWAMDGREKKKGDRKACALGGTAARGQSGRRGAPKRRADVAAEASSQFTADLITSFRLDAAKSVTAVARLTRD